MENKETNSLLRRRKPFDASGFFSNRIENILTESSFSSVQYIDISKLKSFKNQQRTYFDDEKINSLANTIQEHGIRQPLTVIQSEDGDSSFEIVSGERRFLAAKKVGLSKVPCIIIHNRDAAEEIAIIENVQRVDLHPIELGRAYSALLEKGIVKSNVELAKKIGVPRTQVSEYIGFSKIPEEISSILISTGVGTRRVLRKIVSCKNADEMNRLISGASKQMNKSTSKTIFKISMENGQIVPYINEDVSLSEEQISFVQNSINELVGRLKVKQSLI